nr:transaldolase family protein [Gleimia europaea]
MAIYFDSADCAQMRKYASTGVFSGVTSNPTILVRQGLCQQDIPELYRTLQEFGFDRLFFQTAGCT